MECLNPFSFSIFANLFARPIALGTIFLRVEWFGLAGFELSTG
jgi:hypothetical protein